MFALNLFIHSMFSGFALTAMYILVRTPVYLRRVPFPSTSNLKDRVAPRKKSLFKKPTTSGKIELESKRTAGCEVELRVDRFQKLALGISFLRKAFPMVIPVMML